MANFYNSPRKKVHPLSTSSSVETAFLLPTASSTVLLGKYSASEYIHSPVNVFLF